MQRYANKNCEAILARAQAKSVPFFEIKVLTMGMIVIIIIIAFKTKIQLLK